MPSKKQHCYDYPHPAVTVDLVVVRDGEFGSEVLLIKRKSEPYKGKWAIPGGFVDEDEALEKAAARELEEETGLKRVKIEQFGAFGDPGRDPRGRTISIAYRGTVDARRKVEAGDDASETGWFPVVKLPSLAFDHRQIIKAALGSAVLSS